MSFSSSYLEKRKKRLKEREKQLDNKFNNDIAPVGGNKDSWFKGGALADGYEFGDITKTILGTVGDAGIGIVKGAGRMVEGIADVATYGVAGVADLFGADSFADDARDVAKFSATDEFTAPVTDYVDRFSLLGNKADSVTEGLGQVGTILLTGGAGGAAGLGTGGVTALTTGVTGLSSMGGGMSQAYTEGATDEEALTYGLIAGVAEAGTELLFGGLGKAVGAVGLSKGISSLDDALAKKVSSKIANQTMKNFAEFGIKAGAEGTEEVISGILQAFGKKATYMSEEELGKLLKDENLLDSFIVGTITSGITQSGIVPGMKRGSLIEANKQGADFITGHTETEQKVIDKVTESSVTEREKELGRKLNAKERAEIEEDVETKLIKGGISIDTIEETLGGDSYKAYKEATEKQEALKKELNELRNMKKGEMTDIQADRLTELKAMDLEDTSKVDELKAKASQDVFELIKADRKGQGSILAESYNERERRGVAFEVDTNKVDSKKADTYKRAMEAGVLNNTNATHDFVDLVATLEAEKGVKIDFSNNEKLKASGFAVDGAEVNGIKTNGGIILNANSRKNLNVVVGHEITHILEGTELYTALRDTIISYAKSKGDYDARYKATSKLYEKVNDTDIDGEITADLVGEYLFTDEKFIKNLTTNKNLFKKVYDEIKYLVKVATAGSAEKKQLLKVQRAFEKAFESSKTEKKATKNTTKNSGAKYSLSKDAKSEVENVLNDKNYSDYVKLTDTTPSILLSQKGVKNLPMLMKPSHIRENVLSEEEAKSKGLRVDGRINYHGLGKDLFLKVIDDLDNVTEAYRGTKNADNSVRRENYFLLISKQTDADGNVINVPVFINEKGTYHRVDIDTNKVATIFGRYELKEYIKREIQKGNLVKIKNRSHLITSDSTTPIVAQYGKNASMWEKSSSSNPATTKVAQYETDNSNNSIPQNTDSVNREFSENQKKTDSDNVGYSDKALFSLSEIEDIAPVYNTVDNVDIAHIANKYSDIEEQIKANEEKLESLMAEYEKISNMVDNGEMSVADFDFMAADITKEYDDTKRRLDALTYELTEIEKNNVTVTDAIKNYSKKDALVVVERMGVNDLTKAARKKLADDLWEGMNKNTTVEQREAFAREFAKTATDTIIKKSRKENPGYNSAKEQLPYITSGIGRLTFTTEDMAELRYKYDKDLKKFLGRWGYKGGTNADGTPKRRYPMSQFVIDYARETAGMSHLEDMHHAEAMIEINELYEDLSAEVKNRWVNSYAEATKEEMESLKADIERTVLEAFETEGRDARAKKGLEAAYDKIDKQFEADKASLDKAFEKSKENALAMSNERDRSVYIANLEERYAMRLAELTEQVKREKELAKKESERVRRKDLHNSIIEAIKAEYTKRGLDFDEVLDKGKRKGNFASVDNTPQRFIEKTLGYKEGQILNDLTVNKIALNESAGIKWLNGQVDNIRKLSEKYNIKPGSKESAAAQMYGEGFYVNKEGEYVKYGDAELAKDFPSIEVQNNIKALAQNSEVRRMYDETLDAINASRVRNGYPEIPKRADYFLHFRAMDDTFSRLGIPFNPNDIKAKDLPTDINGMTANLKPGQPYFASANKRMGIRTTYDLLGGIERYMNSAKNQIYHIDDIQTLRAVRNYVADRYGQANGLNDLDSMTPDEQEARIKDVYDGHLSTFAKFLNEEANIIAGKTSLMDRSVEGIFGRRAMQVLNTINSQVGKNMVGFNISSAGTNFLPLVQAAAKLRKSDMIKAFSQTISNKFNSDGFVENDPTLIRRKGADKFAKTAWEKASDIGYVLMSAVDNLASEVIVRAKYNELTRSGLDSEQAHIKAGEWASRLMGDRSLGQMPQLFNSKTLGIFTKFQLEVRNQLDSMFYDSFQEAKENTENIQDTKERIAKTASKVASTLAQLFVFQHIFGMVYEQIAGYNPTFDILSTLATLFGWDDEEESEDTFADNLQQAFNELFEDLPYTSIFTGGRIPMSAALPVEELLTGKDEWGSEVSRLETLAEIAPYYILPTGWGQLKKTIGGLSMFSDEHPIAGSYTDSGNLRFPVEETPLNIAQAAVFGQYANKNAREYFDNEYAPLTPNQVEEFMATGMSYSEYSKKKKAKKIKEAKAKELIYSIVGGEDLYQEYTDALSEIKAGVYVDRKTRVLGYLNSLDIDYVTKLILYKKQFPNDNRFNVSLVNNLNERDDISYSEMEAILTELGFQVDEDGNIKW